MHTPLVFTVWYLPAYLLDRHVLDIELLEAGFVTMRTSQLHIDLICRLLGESLFPMLLVDHSGTNRREKPSLIHLPPDFTPLGGLFQAMFWKVYTGEIHSFSRVSWLLGNFWFGVSKRVGM